MRTSDENWARVVLLGIIMAVFMSVPVIYVAVWFATR